jgi:hypothetical protein
MNNLCIRIKYIQKIVFYSPYILFIELTKN